MEEEVKRLLDAFDAMRNEANVNACFGEPVEVDGRTVIPVAKIGYGFGIGTGTGRSGSPERAAPDVDSEAVPAAGGGGATTSPIGYIEVRDGQTRVEPVIDQQKLAIVSMLAGAWCVFWFSRALTAIFGSRD